MRKSTGEPEPLVKLGNLLQSCSSVIVLLSGGMDSGFLLWACTKFLSKNCIKAVTFNSPTTPRRELERAIQTANLLQVEHIIIDALLYVIGAVLFTASDVIMIFNTFGGTPKFSMRAANLSLYYLGQLLIIHDWSQL
jgi:7-cyano-7-deazaguanine synthase in queuosine biosynthesis